MKKKTRGISCLTINHELRRYHEHYPSLALTTAPCQVALRWPLAPYQLPVTLTSNRSEAGRILISDIVHRPLRTLFWLSNELSSNVWPCSSLFPIVQKSLSVFLSKVQYYKCVVSESLIISIISRSIYIIHLNLC